MVEMMKKRTISSQIICDTAKDLGYNIEIINKEKNLFIIKDKNKEILFKSTDCGINSSLALKLCNDKGLTYDVLGRNNIRIAKSIYLNKDDINKFYYNEIGINYPLVVKPLDLGHGNGVHTEIKTKEELKNAIYNAFELSDNIIIQEHIYGDEHRILVIGNKVIYGIRRIPAYVIGDGNSNVRRLIQAENNNPLRGDGYDKPMSTINIDNNLINYIKKYYDYDLETIPENGKRVTLRGISNVSGGGFLTDVTKYLSIEFKEECVKIAKTLGLKIAGIDIITRDVSKKLMDSKGVVLEVGATPGFGGGIESTGINPAEHLLNFVFNDD